MWEWSEAFSSLCLAPGAAGQTSAADLAESLVGIYCSGLTQDKMGNVVGFLKGCDESLPTLLLEAHIDQVGFTVTAVNEDGTLSVAPMGGIDSRLLNAADVTVHTAPPTEGFIIPEEGVPPVDKRRVEVGLTGEEAKARIPVGTAVTYKPHYTPLLNGRVSATSLDDRAGVQVILRCLQLLEGDKLPCRVAILFAVQEEVGERGSAPGAFLLEPDAALCTDVSFAAMPGEDPRECGELGKGPMIGVAPTLDQGISAQLKELAVREGIPYQMEIMEGRTGTDADRIGLVRTGVPCGLLSIPQRYMHTQVETVELADVENTARLMAAFVREWGKRV